MPKLFLAESLTSYLFNTIMDGACGHFLGASLYFGETSYILFLHSFKTKKEPGVSDRNINGLMEGESYMFKARFWSDAL